MNVTQNLYPLFTGLDFIFSFLFHERESIHRKHPITGNIRHPSFLTQRKSQTSYSGVNFHSALLRIQSNAVSASSWTEFILGNRWRDLALSFCKIRSMPDIFQYAFSIFLFAIVAELEHSFSLVENNKNTLSNTETNLEEKQQIRLFLEVTEWLQTGSSLNISLAFIFLALEAVIQRFAQTHGAAKVSTHESLCLRGLWLTKQSNNSLCNYKTMHGFYL